MILKKIEITQNKSKTLTFPLINKKYIHDFIRGYFDGDGYIGNLSDGKGNNYIRCSISGTEQFLSTLKQIFNEMFNVKTGSIRFANRCYELTFGGNKSPQLFLDWIYKTDSTLKLERKYLKYKQFTGR